MIYAKLIISIMFHSSHYIFSERSFKLNYNCTCIIPANSHKAGPAMPHNPVLYLFHGSLTSFERSSSSHMKRTRFMGKWHSRSAYRFRLCELVALTVEIIKDPSFNCICHTRRGLGWYTDRLRWACNSPRAARIGSLLGQHRNGQDFPRLCRNKNGVLINNYYHDLKFANIFAL